MVPQCSVRIPRVRTYFGYCQLTLDFVYETITPYGCASHHIRLSSAMHFTVHNPKCISTLGLASSAFARHYWRNLVDFFSSAYLDVSLRQVPLLQLWIHCKIRDSSSRGFPHSDICGSRLICSSPQLFAAYRVLLRLLMPRHSPCALLRLNFFRFGLEDTSILCDCSLLFSCLSYRK